ncbi:MAG: DedA family protein [Rhodospirillaceae bacterium]
MVNTDNATEIIQSYGNMYYIGIFLWTFLEGETIVLLSGVAAKHGVVDIYRLIVTAWTGAFLGDQLYFYIGRRWGEKLLNKFERFKPSISRAIKLLERFSTIFILTFRFLYAVRNVSPFAIGMSTITWLRFAVINFIAAGIWAIAFAGGGYLAGAALEGVFGTIGLVLSGLLLATGLFMLHRHANK